MYISLTLRTFVDIFQCKKYFWTYWRTRQNTKVHIQPEFSRLRIYKRRNGLRAPNLLVPCYKGTGPALTKPVFCAQFESFCHKCLDRSIYSKELTSWAPLGLDKIATEYSEEIANRPHMFKDRTHQTSYERRTIIQKAYLWATGTCLETTPAK